MESTQRLQQQHPQSHSLHIIQHPKVQPKSRRKVRSDLSRPVHVESDPRRSPEHLAPPGRSESDGDHGDQPTVDFGVSGEDHEADDPNDDEEEEDEEDDAPDGDVGVLPQERPVASVRRGEPEVWMRERGVGREYRGDRMRMGEAKVSDSPLRTSATRNQMTMFFLKSVP